MAFPPDACSLIVKYVADSRPTLVALCTVSKQFQIPAERALYNTLHLRGYDNTVSLCRVLSRTTRVALLVVALSVYGQEEGSDSEAEDFEPSDDYWTLLHDALRRTTRLRFLNLYYSGGGETDKAWVLEGCSFQLRTFHCDFTWDRNLAAFLSTQSRLADLYLADFREPEPEAATHPNTMALDLPTAPSGISTSAFLPKLCILECTFSEAAVALVPGRPVARVKTCFTHSKHEEKCVELHAIVGALRQTKKRLRALDIADSSYTADFSLELLSSLSADAFFCGDLRYLGTLVFPVDGRKVGQGVLCRLICRVLTTLLAFRVLCIPHAHAAASLR